MSHSLCRILGSALSAQHAALQQLFSRQFPVQVAANKASSLDLTNRVVRQTIRHVLQWAGCLSFPPLNVVRARQLAPVTVLYTANVCFALLGLQSLNIPM